MKLLCDNTHQQVTTELDNVKAARLEAMASIQELEAKSASLVRQKSVFALGSLSF